jgi:DNA mismatch repair protein MutL
VAAQPTPMRVGVGIARAKRSHRMHSRPIRQLDAATIAQIAAGEVIERPVSVVKELVENSLDAAATWIAVDVADGGRTSIAVSDDGNGIPREQLALAFARHATSKLADADELFAIRTLGFRGEGLASIAAAGNVELVSRPADQEMGARVAANGISIGEPSACAAPPGTKVIVRDLFALTPARREFVKSARAEFARISAYLGKLALGWPAVTFVLRHDGSEVWTLPAVRDGVDRLEMVFGRGARGALVQVNGPEHARVSVAGYVSKPGNDRANRDGQVLFVNGRLVRSGAIGTAWTAGHGSFGMTGRFPFGVLALTLEPGDVDCNVHPTKIEVRFARGNEVFEAVKLAVARTLRGLEPTRQAPEAAFAATSALDLRTPIFSALEERAPTSPEERAPTLEGLTEQRAPASDGVRVYGQIDQTFIVAADRAGLLVIDQHAAHERIAYEAILAREGAGEAGTPLLVPQIVELSDAQVAVLHDHEDELALAGVRVEPFGERAYRLVALPSGYEKRRFDLSAMLDDLLSDDAAREGPAHRNRVLATIACHSVVRAHEPLSLQEQAALYQRLQTCKDPHTCPHGRPTMLRIDAASLTKAFRR